MLFRSVDGENKPGTIGLPLVDVQMKIVDDDMNELPNGEVGEIVVKSPSNFIGYLNQPEATEATLVDGWVRTGDLGDRDDDGYFRILDRKKDLIIVGGLNVYSQEVEYYLSQYAGVRECAVVGVPDAVRGEVPVAYVVEASPGVFDAADARSFLRERIARYKIPKEFRTLDELPRNPTGKVMKSLLRS